uniref:Uncharacterized protein n=1 Tax=Sarcophilus harrisii TaxID=9305 RepID=A0A7N4PPR5_SARHA
SGGRKQLGGGAPGSPSPIASPAFNKRSTAGPGVGSGFAAGVPAALAEWTRPGSCRFLFSYVSGRRRGHGTKARVEGRGELGSAQTITMGPRPQNISLFRANDSIKWTPAMLLA